MHLDGTQWAHLCQTLPYNSELLYNIKPSHLGLLIQDCNNLNTVSMILKRWKSQSYLSLPSFRFYLTTKSISKFLKLKSQYIFQTQGSKNVFYQHDFNFWAHWIIPECLWSFVYDHYYTIRTNTTCNFVLVVPLSLLVPIYTLAFKNLLCLKGNKTACLFKIPIFLLCQDGHLLFQVR